jgi:hypothetical protein
MSKPVSAAAKERAAVVALLYREIRDWQRLHRNGDLSESKHEVFALRYAIAKIKAAEHLPTPRKPRKGARTRSRP